MNWGELKNQLEGIEDDATIFICTDEETSLAHEFSEKDVLINCNGDILIMAED